MVDPLTLLYAANRPDNSGSCGALCFLQTVVNYSSNAVYWMPVAGSILLAVCILLAHSGQATALYYNPENRAVRVLLLLVSGIAVLVAFGLDLAVWSFLAVFNLAVIAGAWFERGKRREAALIAVPAAMLAFALAGIFALPGILLGALYLVLSECRKGACLLGFVFCFAVVLGVISPAPQLPIYPAGAEVVPSYNTLDGLTPFIGDQLPVKSVNLAAVRERLLDGLYIPLLAVFAATFLLGYVPRIPVALLFCVALESSLLKPFYAQMTPVQSLSRILPGGLFYPLSYLMVAGLISVLSLEIQTNPLMKQRFNPLRGAIHVCCWAILALGSWGLFRPNVDLRLQRELDTTSSKLLSSPSYFVASSVGVAEIDKRFKQNNLAYVPIGDSLIGASSNSGKIDFNLLSDGRSATGWHTAEQKQQGDEWLELSLRDPVAAIRLDTGVYFSDFPRGIRVRYMEQCPEHRIVWTGAPIAVNFSPNYGDLAVTPEGYPYFSQQYSVSAILPQGKSARCFFVEQTGADEHYAWTVADVIVVPFLEEKGQK